MQCTSLYYTTFFNNQNTTIPVTILFPKDFVFNETAKTIKEAIKLIFPKLKLSLLPSIKISENTNAPNTDVGTYFNHRSTIGDNALLASKNGGTTRGI